MVGRKLVVAVSGGPDSMALLDTLLHLQEDLQLTLHGAHLNHQLRGQASRDDAQFVSEHFLKSGFESTVESANVADYQKAHRLSLEEAAREVRYAFLARLAKQHDADAIAVGHTSNDQAESVLMHLVRGSGLTGLRGMQPVTSRSIGNEKIQIIRPLLNVTRDQTEAYCAALELQPRLDATNDIPDMTRNRVRTELLPALESYNPSIRRALVRLSANAALDMDFIQGQVDAVWDDVCRQPASELLINLIAFRELHPAMQRHMLRRAVLQVKGDLDDVEQNHIEDMARLAQGSAGKALDLPGGVKFAVGYVDATLVSAKSGQPVGASASALEGCHMLSIPGETRLPGWNVQISSQNDGDLSKHSGLTASLSRQALGDKVWVRSRRPGDRFQPLGMAHTKKLQDFMVDCKIPRGQRDGVPLVVTPRGIAWVVGWRIADWAKVSDETNDSLLVNFTRLI